jgi:hypothetical protein
MFGALAGAARLFDARPAAGFDSLHCGGENRTSLRWFAAR